MIEIAVRMRDISYEEALQCITPDHQQYMHRSNWEQLRRMEIRILTPAIGIKSHPAWACAGPFFRVTMPAFTDPKGSTICAHLAEIGD